MLNYLFNNEKMSCLQIISIFSAMIGVIFLTMFPSEKIEMQKESYPYFGFGVTVALIGSLSSGFTYLAMRKCGNEVHSVVSPFWYGVFAMGCFGVMVVV